MLVALALNLLPCALPQQPIIQTLVSSYTPGDQLCLEVADDPVLNVRRGFLAEGATIVVLNLDVTPPTVIATHPMPDCQPLAMRYYKDQWGARYLFIAGGAFGVYRLTLCSSLFQPPLGTCTAGFGDLRIEAALPTGSFERKRCVDVDVLPTANGPVLFALFAASSNPSQSSVGPTELHAYKWDQTGTTTHIAGFQFAWSSLTSPVEVGTCLAVDPNDNDSIYVGMGKGGIRRIDLGPPANPTLTQVQPYTWTCPTGTNYPQHVRDIAIVSVPTVPVQSVLYAALNYNELLEITNLGAGTQAYSRTVLDSAGPPARPPGYAERVAAIVSGTSTFVAVTAQKNAGKWDDAIAPYTVNGFWSDICLTIGAADPDDPGLTGTHDQVQFFRHDFPAGQPTFKSLIDYTALHSVGAPGTESAILKPGPGLFTYRLFMCSRTAGTEIYDIDPTAGSWSSLGVPFVGETYGGQEGTISLRNPSVIEFVAESTGVSLPTNSMAYIDQLQPPGISTVSKTDHSPCDNPAPAPPPGSPDCAYEGRDPGLYGSNIFEEAHWLDTNPANPWGEYFVAGRRLLERFSLQGVPPPSCAVDADCSSASSFCYGNGDPRWWLRKRNYQTNPLGDPIYRTGWRVINLAIPPTVKPASGPSMSPRWWEINLPDDTGTTTTDPAEVAAPGDDRLSTITDTRMTAGLPNVVYLTRSGTTHGVKVLKTGDIVTRAENSCSPGSSRGIGEYLPFSVSDYRSVLTHVELQINPSTGLGCAEWVSCNAQWFNNPHQLANNRSVLYTTKDLSGATMYVLAVASGFPASFVDGQHTQNSSCLWTPYAGQPMLILMDVTKTGQVTGAGAFGRPKVLRVALGSIPNAPAPQGHAISVCTMASGPSTYAFVGDIMGMIWVFDVTGSKLLPAPTGAYLPGNQPLKPVARIPLPRDPYDGYAANCIDLLIVDKFLYCALGRQGIGVVDISNPLAPVLLDVMDTPGLALGLTRRIVSTPQGQRNQLIVGDSRCGIRVYQD